MRRSLKIRSLTLTALLLGCAPGGGNTGTALLNGTGRGDGGSTGNAQTNAGASSAGGTRSAPGSAGSAESGAPASSTGGAGGAGAAPLPLPTGTYRIINKLSNEAMNVADASLKSGGALQQSAYEARDDQKWKLGAEDSAGRRIIGLQSGECATAGALGAGILQSDCGTGQQRFSLTRTPTGFFVVGDVATGGCMEVAGGSTAAGAPIQTAVCDGSDGQRWRIERVDHTSGNPLIKSIFTADPSAHAFPGGSLWLYPSHDPDNASDWAMTDYHVFSSTDLSNWNDHGVALAASDISWGEAYLYAPDCAYRDGKYFLYFPKTEGNIGVAVSDSPAGPFADALGKPLIDRSLVPDVQRVFDPGVFIDDDGQAYLVFGGGDSGNDARIVKLAQNMIALASAVTPVVGLQSYFEAPWLHRRGNHYYLSYSAKHGADTTIDYGMADNPLGPYAYRGTVLGDVPYWTNHHSIVEYGDRWYIFYHVGVGSDYTRRVSLDYLYYNDDDTIAPVLQTPDGVEALGN